MTNPEPKTLAEQLDAARDGQAWGDALNAFVTSLHDATWEEEE